VTQRGRSGPIPPNQEITPARRSKVAVDVTEREQTSEVAHYSPSGVMSVWCPRLLTAYRRPMQPRMSLSRKSRAPFLAAAICAVAVTIVGYSSGVTPASGSGMGAVHPPSATVVGDDQNDLYIGTGSLLIPSRGWQGDPGGRQSAAACVDCTWKITRYCPKADFAAGKCRRIRLGCPIGTMRVRVWLQRPGESWTFVGITCQGSSPPHTISEVGSVVRDRAVALLPALRPGVQPANGILLGIPAVFRTGQPASGIHGADLSVLDLSVRLDSRVGWAWAYGDGTTAWTSAPGGLWPNTSVSHPYLRAGPVIAHVTARWRGEYTVDGLGPFAVPGPPLTQEASIRLEVRPARAHLVG